MMLAREKPLQSKDFDRLANAPALLSQVMHMKRAIYAWWIGFAVIAPLSVWFILLDEPWTIWTAAAYALLIFGVLYAVLALCRLHWGQ